MFIWFAQYLFAKDFNNTITKAKKTWDSSFYNNMSIEDLIKYGFHWKDDGVSTYSYGQQGMYPIYMGPSGVT